MILQNIFAAEAEKVAKQEKKLVAVAGTRFLCETDLLCTNAHCWTSVLVATTRSIDAFVSSQEGDNEDVEDDIDVADELLEKIESQGGYSASYSKLSAAKSKRSLENEKDVLSEIPDCESFLGQNVVAFAAKIGNPQIIREALTNVDVDAQACVQRCLQKVSGSI